MLAGRMSLRVQLGGQGHELVWRGASLFVHNLVGIGPSKVLIRRSVGLILHILDLQVCVDNFRFTLLNVFGYNQTSSVVRSS